MGVKVWVSGGRKQWWCDCPRKWSGQPSPPTQRPPPVKKHCLLFLQPASTKINPVQLPTNYTDHFPKQSHYYPFPSAITHTHTNFLLVQFQETQPGQTQISKPFLCDKTLLLLVACNCSSLTTQSCYNAKSNQSNLQKVQVPKITLSFSV